MEDIKVLARAAKQRLKSNFWNDCKKNFDDNAIGARERGVSELKVKSTLKTEVKKRIRGDKPDEFYLKVKAMLDAEGEVSDAIGRLTDREYYEKLTYEERQRYTMDLSTRYLAAVSRWRREKELK